MKELKQKADAIVDKMYTELSKSSATSSAYKENIEAFARLLEAETKMYEAESKAVLDYEKAEADKEAENKNRLADLFKSGLSLLSSVLSGAFSIWGICKITSFENDGGIVRSEAKNFVTRPKR